MSILRKALTLATRIGAEPDDSDDMRLKKLLLTGALLLLVPVLSTIGALYWLYAETWAASIFIGFSIFIVINLIIFDRWHRNPRWLLYLINFGGLTAHIALFINLGGFVNSSGIVQWGVLNALGTIIIVGPRQALLWFLWYVFNLWASIFLEPYLPPTNNVPHTVVLTLFGLNLLIPSAFACGIVAYFLRQRDVAFSLLRSEQERAENLLLNILPKDIAAILKQENRVIADHYDGASILFADLVNFTPMSVEMTPIETVEMLNQVFSRFDALVDKYGLEKIKTVGDCYMVASGVPRPRADHAQVLTQFALEMRDYVSSHTFQGRQLTFRIGINSGPVVAGVIGRKKFIYDLWGDAVNTASRMESHGAGGIIQITRATYDLIKDEFDCEPRGRINVKGKGEMDVWQVLGCKREMNSEVNASDV